MTEISVERMGKGGLQSSKRGGVATGNERAERKIGRKTEGELLKGVDALVVCNQDEQE